MQILTKKDVCEYLGITESTLSTQMVRRPESVPAWFKRPGSKKPLWLKATVEAFLRKCAEDAGALPVGEESGK